MDTTENRAGAPDAREGTQSLSLLATDLLEQARAHHSRRSATTLVGGPVMRSTLIALAQGAELAEHDAPPAATLQAVSGQVRLHAGARHWDLSDGDLVGIPQERHAVTAITDAVILLTVALHGGAGASG